MGLSRRNLLKGLASVPFFGILAENHMAEPEKMLIKPDDLDVDWDEPLDLGLVNESGSYAVTGEWRADRGRSGFICCSG